MSQQNVELARRGMGSMDAFFSLLDECIVADVRAFPLPDYSGLVVGRDKFIEMSRHYWGAWEDYRVEAEEFIDAGQSVVVGIHERGRGKGSGVQLDRRWAYIWTFREGRIVRWEPRRSIEDAVKAAGLPAKPSPRENVEIVRALAEGFQHRQHERAFEFYDPEIEWDASAFAEVNPDIAAVYHGHEGVRAYWRHWLSAWSDLHFEIQDVVDAGDDVVLLIRNQRQWGRHSGIPTDAPPYGMVFSFREGKVVRWRVFPDQESALEAAGLSGLGDVA